MPGKTVSFWVKFLGFVLSSIGLSGCLSRGFSCVYGGPPESYRDEEVVEQRDDELVFDGSEEISGIGEEPSE